MSAVEKDHGRSQLRADGRDELQPIQLASVVSPDHEELCIEGGGEEAWLRSECWAGREAIR
jgi:hypothetical protein